MSLINSFEDVTIGNAANATIQFILPKTTDIANAYMTFELLDEDGIVYSSGNGTSLVVIPKANSKVVESSIVVNVPSNIPVNDLGTTYQVRVTLRISSTEITQLYSNLRVLPNYIKYEGTTDVIDLKGNVIEASILIDGIPSAINAVIYYQNEMLDITALVVSSPTQTADGYLYTTSIDTNLPLIDNSGAAFYPRLEPYTLVWQYVLNGNNNTEVCSVWIVFPSMLMAAKDLLSEINKARSGLGDKPTFSVEDAFLYLRLGGDYWNAYEQVTNFTFLNATGGVRSFWLGYSKIFALRAQYLYEAESNFDFQGNAIQLSVQREQYYESLASALENQLNEPARKFKLLLSKRGNIDGDGNVNPTKMRTGSLANVGVTLSAVSRLRPWNPNSWLGGQRSIF